MIHTLYWITVTVDQTRS